MAIKSSFTNLLKRQHSRKNQSKDNDNILKHFIDFSNITILKSDVNFKNVSTPLIRRWI